MIYSDQLAGAERVQLRTATSTTMLTDIQTDTPRQRNAHTVCTFTQTNLIWVSGLYFIVHLEVKVRSYLNDYMVSNLCKTFDFGSDNLRTTWT